MLIQANSIAGGASVKELDKFRKDVEKDLREQRRIGIKVSEKAITAALLSRDMKDYTNMSVTDCADLLIKLYPLK